MARTDVQDEDPESHERIFQDAVRYGNRSVWCFHVVPTSSAGFWSGENPIDYPFPNLIYQISLIFVVYTALHLVLRRMHQPIYISQVVAGFIIGPCIMAKNPRFNMTVNSPRIYQQFNTANIVGYMLFNFMAGLKADLNMLRKTGKKALGLAIFSTFVPALAVYLVFVAVRNNLPSKTFGGNYLIVVLADRWCMTSFVVLSTTLGELNLLSSKLGRLTLSASLISNVLHLFGDVFVTIFTLCTKLGSPLKGLEAACYFLALTLVIVFVLKPIVLHLVRRTPEGEPLGEGSLVAVIVMALGCGLITKIIGLDLTTGTFFFGLVLPEGEPLGTTLAQRMDSVVMPFLLPMFFATAGARVNFANAYDVGHWLWMEIFLVLCVVAKFFGSLLPCIYCKMMPRDTITVGLMMICKGIHELSAAVYWQQDRVIDYENYSMLIMTLVVVSAITAPLIKYLYRPEDRYVSYKCRTLEHARPTDELRLLACIYDKNNVNPAIAVLKASGPCAESPVCVYLLHLIQLIGRANAVLLPHKHRGRSSSTSATTLSDSDHIVNAFETLFKEQYDTGYTYVLPFVCICPYSTMHDDICSLSLDKKVTIVILPFHKYVDTAGNVTSNPSARAVNINVLRYAPCSVGILIDTQLSGVGSTLHHVAVYFIGGPDDREALAYGMRMADHTGVRLTVVRFLPPREWRQEGREEKIDERMIRMFQNEKVDGRRVMYVEEEVKDGEETVAVIRGMSPEFGLLVVGRREGNESSMTSGLSTWSEFPELGIIGDLLTSTDFSGGVSTLVVKQQVRVMTTMTQVPDSPPKARTPTARTAGPDEFQKIDIL